ncbi:MAG TPA: metal ABC transporter substrate-binding protein [Verrucomicrobiae bacterium]
MILKNKQGGGGLWLLLLWLLAVVPASHAAEKLKVLTSFLPVYCFAANVAGEHAAVENFLPPGAGPHDYQFTPRDIRKLTDADVILISGLNMEGWLNKAIESSGSKKAGKVSELAAGLKKEQLIRDEHGISLGGKDDHDHSHGPNPHIWLDPQLAIHCVKNVEAALSKADPKNAANYAVNAKAYIARLEKLDADIAAMLTPVKGSAFVTFHNAFPYMVKRYGLKLAGVVEEVPEVQPSPRYLSKLLEVMRKSKTKVLFAEPQFPKKIAERIAADSGVPLGTLDTLETGDFKPGTYEEGMRRNAGTLQRYLK